ncbi:MAG: dihydroorotate dehydrogenase [Gemmataceae bacterium]
MPDWTYQTVFRPALFALPATRARNFALGAMGMLARLPLGGHVIDFMGHMRPDPRLQRQLFDITFPSPVGLGPALDTNAEALPALARFGFGFLEVGPVSLEIRTATAEFVTIPDWEALAIPDPPTGLALSELVHRLESDGPLGVPLIVRFGEVPPWPVPEIEARFRAAVELLRRHVAVFSLATLRQALREDWTEDVWRDHVRMLVALTAAGPTPRPLLLLVPTSCDTERFDQFLTGALAEGIAGVIVDGAVPAQGDALLLGGPARASALACVTTLRDRLGPGLAIIASGGVHDPADALELLAAGANLVETDSGLVYSGPGLPKRVNDAVLFATTPSAMPELNRAAEMSWFWLLLLGAGMLFGGLLALVIAATRVVLPYDEQYIGLARDQFSTINPRLLAFMAHDRVSLAGTMIAVGAFYVFLSWFGVRRGLHWARKSLLMSAFAGFASFFLFLGFGYFDPFHAFVTAVLLQLLLMALHAKLGPADPPAYPDLRRDRAWRMAQWGQLLFVVHGVALIGAGVVIAGVGSAHVFVPEDLEFMQTTREALHSANPRLVPVVAHDRASFGGMLVSNGLVMLTSALWGFRRGLRWLWWMYLAASVPAYAAAIGVHLVVGYLNPAHLAPPLAGVGLLLAGAVLSYRYLVANDPAHRAAWAKFGR